MRKRLVKPFQVWKKIFPNVKLEEGMFVKCEDGRYKDGYLIGQIQSIGNYWYSISYLPLEIETVPQTIIKRETTVMEIVTEEDYKKWTRKHWKLYGYYSVILNGDQVRLERSVIEHLIKSKRGDLKFKYPAERKEFEKTFHKEIQSS